MNPRPVITNMRWLVHIALAAFISIAALEAQSSPGGQAATNDTAASFVNGMFLLPDLKSPKDAYLIVITPDVGPPVKLSLPQGVTGVRVGDMVLPSGSWKWAYKVTLEQPAALALVTQTDLRLLPNDVPMTGKVLVQWNNVPGAVTYSISGKALTPQRSDLPPKEVKLDAVCYVKTCLKNGIPTFGLEAAPGSDITWRVAALDADGVVLAQSAEAHIAVGQTTIQEAKDRGLSIQNSDTLSKLTASDPATLMYTSSSKGTAARTSAYQAQFAIIYDSPDAWEDFYPRVSLEARLTSTGDEKPKDALIFRAGVYKFIFRNPGRAEGTEWVSNLKYETERNTGTKKGIVEIGFTPVYGLLGQYAHTSGIKVAPTFSFGTEVGKTFDVGSSEEKKDTVLRLRATARLDAQFNRVARFLGFRSVTAYLQAIAWHLPKEDGQQNFRLGSTGLSFGLTDFMSFDLAYSSGRKAPLFTFEQTGTVGIGVKF